MAQDTQSIGKLAPAAEITADQALGWQGGGPVDTLIDERTDHDYSRWNNRANRQQLGLIIDNMAGHTENPAAAQEVSGW